jgi:hypothetical protein
LVANPASPVRAPGIPGIVGNGDRDDAGFTGLRENSVSTALTLAVLIFPSKPGSMARMRASSGGWVASAPRNGLPRPLPKNM